MRGGVSDLLGLQNRLEFFHEFITFCFQEILLYQSGPKTQGGTTLLFSSCGQLVLPNMGHSYGQTSVSDMTGIQCITRLPQYITRCKYVLIMAFFSFPMKPTKDFSFGDQSFIRSSMMSCNSVLGSKSHHICGLYLP